MNTIYDMGGHNMQDTQRISDQQAEIEQLKVSAKRSTMRVAELVAQNATLRRALEAVEWTTDVRFSKNDMCHWCGNYESDGHRADCQRQAALADPSPLAEAAGAVLQLIEKWRETAFKSDWEPIDEDLAEAADLYLALRDGCADGGG